MITQAAISLSGRKAFIFCRQNALYLAYAKNNVPSDPMVMQNGVYPGFNICPQKDGFLIFFRTSANTGAALKLTPGGILRPRLDENVLNVSTGTVFVYRPDKNTVLYSAPNGFIHSLSRQKALFESDNISSCRCIFLGDESYIVFARDSRLCLYSAGAEKTFELYRNAESVCDTSFCRVNGITHACILVRSGTGFELVYKTIDQSGASKGISLIKTASAQNTFIFPYAGSVRTYVSCESGKVFFRSGESGKLSFSPAESLELAGPAKMPFFEPLLSQSPCCDALCLLDGTIIFPSDSTEKSVQKKGTVSDNSGEIYKKAMAEKDRTIASLSLRLNQLQKSTSDTILSLNAAIKAEQEKNAALMGELSMLKNAQRQISSYSTPEITGPTGDCTYYLTSARVIEGPEETVNSEEDSENFPEE